MMQREKYVDVKVGQKNLLKHTNVFIGDFSNHKWRCKRLHTTCHLITKWRIHNLKIAKNNQANILKQIEHIHFSNIIYLDVGTNLIESVENLSRIWLPTLYFLYMRDNYVWEVKALRKCNWPSISNLELQGNEILQMGRMVEMQMPTITYIEMETCIHHREQDSNLAWVAKAGMKNLSRLSIKGKRRITQQKIFTTLKRRWDQCRLVTVHGQM